MRFRKKQTTSAMLIVVWNFFKSLGLLPIRPNMTGTTLTTPPSATVLRRKVWPIYLQSLSNDSVVLVASQPTTKIKTISRLPFIVVIMEMSARRGLWKTTMINNADPTKAIWTNLNPTLLVLTSAFVSPAITSTSWTKACGLKIVYDEIKGKGKEEELKLSFSFFFFFFHFSYWASFSTLILTM